MPASKDKTTVTRPQSGTKTKIKRPDSTFLKKTNKSFLRRKGLGGGGG